MTVKKREYVTPEARVFTIGAEERLAAACGGGSHFTQIPFGCTDLLVGGRGDAACNEGIVQGS